MKATNGLEDRIFSGLRRAAGRRGHGPRTLAGDADDEAPLRAELFTADQMEQHGKEVAAAHVLTLQRSPDRLLPRLAANEKKLVEVGQLVQPGQMLMNIASDTGLFITANFKETQLDKLRVGQAVELEVDAYDGAKIEGVVESISAATGARFTLLPPDNASGNFTKVVQRVPVRIRITKGLDAARPLRIGLSVVAHVSTK